MAVVLARRLVGIRDMADNEIISRSALERPFWIDFYEIIFIPGLRFYQSEVPPFYLKEIEKMTRRFRIIMLRLECLLMRFGEYIRGKRVLSSNGHKSHYWEELNNCKNRNGNNNGNGNGDGNNGNSNSQI